MHTYLVVCGVIFNLLVLFVIVWVTLDEISVRKINKKRVTENAQKRIQYKEELKMAEQEWQEWVKKLAEMTQECDKLEESKRLLFAIRCREYRYKKYYFASIDKHISLFELGEENNWLYQKQ